VGFGEEVKLKEVRLPFRRRTCAPLVNKFRIRYAEVHINQINFPHFFLWTRTDKRYNNNTLNVD